MALEATITFEPVAPAHDAMLFAWLQEQHVRDWWGDPHEELRLICEGRGNGEAEGHVGYFGTRPVAYLQSWYPRRFDLDWSHMIEAETPGIDMFIGPADATGRGIGPLLMRAYCTKLFEAGARRIVIDPELANRNAISAYSKAGFTRFAQVCEDGVETLLMERRQKEPERR